MPRQELKEQLGALEEQLELLSARARSSLHQGQPSSVAGENLYQTIDALQGLHDLIHDQSLKKSLSAHDFLRRVVSVLVQDANVLGYPIAVSFFGEGKISAEMVEISMGAIVACLKASLRSYRNMPQAVRMQHHLFPTYSVYLEIKADPDGLRFRMLDDAKGYTGGFLAESESEAQFQKLRAQVAKQGGWFSRRSLPKIGGTIEFKIQLPRARFECARLQSGETEILLPSSYISNVCTIEEFSGLVTDDDRLFVKLDSREGMVLAEDPGEFTTAVKVGIADFQFWVLCQDAAERVASRRYPCHEFVEENSWFCNLGLFPKEGVLKALPLVEGEQLMKLYGGWRSTNAGI